jgi:hypothetical protein
MMLNMMEDINRITRIGDDNLSLQPGTDGYGCVAKPDEKQWFEQLPQSLRRYLASVGTTAENFTL